MKKYKIIATLDKGRVFNSGIFLAGALIFFTLFVIIIPFAIKEQDRYFFELNFVNAIISVVLFVLFIKAQKQKKKLNLYLKDCVETYAKVERVGEVVEYGNRTFPRLLTKIRVVFKHDKKTVKLESGEYKNGKTYSKGGFFAGFYKYVGKEIKILYTPKYNKVLFIKQNIKKAKNQKGS